MQAPASPPQYHLLKLSFFANCMPHYAEIVSYCKKGEKKCKVAFFLEQDSISQHNGCNYQIFVWKLSCLLHCILGGFKLPNHVFQSALNSIGSAIMSKLAHQMSNIWIEFAGPISETIRKFDRQKNWVPNYSDKNRNMMKSVWTQNMSSRCTSSTVGKIKIFSQSYFAWLAENSPRNWNKIPCIKGQIISECPYNHFSHKTNQKISKISAIASKERSNQKDKDTD